MRYYLFIILFIIGCSNILYNHNDTMSMLVSKQMVMDKFGEPSELIKRDDLRENNFTLINFFASWCSPCRKEHKYLINLQKKK